MDHAEEQAMEVEMLQAMFMEDFVLDKPEPPAAYRIGLFPETSGDDDANHVGAELSVAYTAAYPVEAPELRLTATLGLSDELAAKALKALVAASADLLGATMVWSLAEQVQAFLREHNAAPAGNMHDEMMKRMAGEGNGGGDCIRGGSDDDEDDDDDGGGRAKKPEAVDERRLHTSYTPVTVENFAAWRIEFDKRTNPAYREDLGGKATGRELFASGDLLLALAAAEAGGDDAEDADYTRHGSDDDNGGGEVAIDEALFDDDDDDDDDDYEPA
ncbi:ubiquitin-conjugating enzyme/RWD-like protein [Pavlovales sp. CCMP2436]|nr:ubiquitin-conjugating enzyme/RWD-like protein [Pavlovales sp. CCMP2436]